MKYTALFGKTLRESSHDIRNPGYALLLKAGYIRSLGQGLISFLPLGIRTLNRLKAILREEMTSLGGQEVVTPLVNPMSLWKQSGRLQLADKDIVSFQDRSGKRMVLSPSHEEAMVDLCRIGMNSYRDFPVFLFQFQLKYRDEEKVKGGLMRTREFEMKDGYSFHRSFTDLNNFFPKVFAAYSRIFERCGIPYVPAESGVGYMGGQRAYEFLSPSQFGDDVLVTCEHCGYAANGEVAKGAKDSDTAAPLPMEGVGTVGCTSMTSLSEKLGLPKSRLIKPVLFKTTEGFLMAVVRGDYEVSIEKINRQIKGTVLRFASPAELRELGLVPGYFSPLCYPEDKVSVLIDDTVADSANLVIGSNEEGMHFINANFGRDFESDHVCDISRVKSGDLCLQCGSPLQETAAVELGHIFKLGEYYSRRMHLCFQDDTGKKVFPCMGSYGIGMGRLLSSIVLANHDDKGIVWPVGIAPFKVFLMGIGKSLSVKRITEELYEQLGSECLIDDRIESVSVKLKDSELIGIPFRVVVSSRSLQEHQVEVYERATGQSRMIDVEQVKEYLTPLIEEK